jgi:hypothetical protein
LTVILSDVLFYWTVSNSFLPIPRLGSSAEYSSHSRTLLTVAKAVADDDGQLFAAYQMIYTGDAVSVYCHACFLFSLYIFSLFFKRLTHRTPVDCTAQISSLLYVRAADGTWLSNRVFAEKRSVSTRTAEQILFGVAPAQPRHFRKRILYRTEQPVKFYLLIVPILRFGWMPA